MDKFEKLEMGHKPCCLVQGADHSMYVIKLEQKNLFYELIEAGAEEEFDEFFSAYLIDDPFRLVFFNPQETN